MSRRYVHSSLMPPRHPLLLLNPPRSLDAGLFNRCQAPVHSLGSAQVAGWLCSVAGEGLREAGHPNYCAPQAARRPE